MPKKGVFYEQYNGYEIRFSPLLSQRPWHAQVPDDPSRYADKPSLAAARNFIDRRIAHIEASK